MVHLLINPNQPSPFTKGLSVMKIKRKKKKLPEGLAKRNKIISVISYSIHNNSRFKFSKNTSKQNVSHFAKKKFFECFVLKLLCF